MKESNVIKIEMSTDVALGFVTEFIESFFEIRDNKDCDAAAMPMIIATIPLMDKLVEIRGTKTPYYDLIIAAAEMIKKIAADDIFADVEGLEENNATLDTLIQSAEFAKKVNELVREG